MIIGVPRETYPGESRVALVPAVVAGLVAAGPEVAVESTAGLKAGFADAEYEVEGARLVARRPDLFAEADILLQVRGQGANLEAGSADLELLRPGQVVLGLLNPLGEPQAMSKLAETGVTALALELLPRTSRAQSMDALSSMGTIAGYKAVLLAASALPKMFPMMMTAAGTVRPAHAFVVGAGVAGLQAIATARRLGAVVEAYDVRPAVKEQVESLGAKFVTLSFEAEEAEGAGGYARAMGEEFYRRQREMMTSVVAQSDVIITTAAVPGTRAPVLITGEMVREMKAGSVIVDLAAETGGNCDLTRPGETVEVDGVAVMGPVNVPSTVPQHASQMYARNLVAFLEVLVKDGQLQVDMDDPHISETLVAHRGEVVNPRVLELLQRSGRTRVGGRKGIRLMEALVISLTVFVLALFVGFEVISKVPGLLHTPLMSGANAMSGITVVGALAAAGAERTTLAVVLGFLAVALATTNVVGGFLVTQRMLQKFRRKN